MGWPLRVSVTWRIVELEAWKCIPCYWFHNISRLRIGKELKLLSFSSASSIRSLEWMKSGEKEKEIKEKQSITHLSNCTSIDALFKANIFLSRIHNKLKKYIIWSASQSDMRKGLYWMIIFFPDKCLVVVEIIFWQGDGEGGGCKVTK